MPPENSNRPTPPEALISVVLPVFNEVAVLNRLTAALSYQLRETGCRYEILYVNDGSSDGSEELLDELAATDSAVRVIHLSRNFGQQAALQAGLSHARGDAIVVMDSDFQDDPAAIPRFLQRWWEGFDVVYAVRVQRTESLPKRFLFRAFYRLLNRISRTPMPLDAGNFGLIDRRVVRVLLRMGETERYFPGLRSWVGHRQTGVPVARLDRHDHNPRVSLTGLCRLAKTAVFSFSTAPLALFYIIAALSCVVCCGVTAFTLYHKLFTQAAVAGWTSGLITASFFGMLNALGVAVLGEYVVRIHDQVRSRPPYLVDRVTESESFGIRPDGSEVRSAGADANRAVVNAG